MAKVCEAVIYNIYYDDLGRSCDVFYAMLVDCASELMVLVTPEKMKSLPAGPLIVRVLSQKGSLFWVLIYISGSLFSLFWLHSRELSHICRHWFRFTLLANFDFYLCLRINFHTSSFWVLILAAGGPYWVLIYISGSLFSLFWLHSRKECQFSLHVYNNELC